MTTERIRVWDLPTRLFHWLLAASFAGAWLTADSERWIDVHTMLGYGFAGLIAFRLVWGLVGSRYARFSSFVRGPGAVLKYVTSILKARPEHHVGHNPAGGWAVLALLGLGAVTALTGYLNFNDYGGHWLEELHEGAASAMLALVFVHIGAVIVSSLIHRENLVRAMLSGLKRRAPE
jgi:cytochrome b